MPSATNAAFTQDKKHYKLGALSFGIYICVVPSREGILSRDFPLALTREIYKNNSTGMRVTLNDIQTPGHEKVPVFIQVFYAF